MENSTLILIAQIAVPTLATIIIGIWQIRIMRSQSEMSSKRPFNQTLAGKILKLIFEFAPGILSLALILHYLINEANSPEPVTRSEVIKIIVAVVLFIVFLTLLVLQIFAYFVNKLIFKTDKITEKISNENK